MDGVSTTISAAEGLLRALKRRGIDYVLANAGTDFAPVIEGSSARPAARMPFPASSPCRTKTSRWRWRTATTRWRQAGRRHGSRDGRHRQHDLRADERRSRQRAAAADGRANAVDARRPYRVALGADSLGAGEFRSGRHHARVHEVGLRAARRATGRRDRQSRARHRAVGAARTGLSDVAARGAREPAQGQRDAFAADRARGAATERAARRHARRVDRSSRVSADLDVESRP